MEFKINSMLASHWPEVSRIYKEGIDTGMATFETKVPSWDDWDASHLKFGRFVAVEEMNNIKQILGWAALSPVSSRCVYGGVAELSVYVKSENYGRGIGKALIKNMIEESEQQGFWTLQSGIFPENVASINLHKKMGFRRIGVRERIGKLNGRWFDNVLMERRSKRVGIE